MLDAREAAPYAAGRVHGRSFAHGGREPSIPRSCQGRAPRGIVISPAASLRVLGPSSGPPSIRARLWRDTKCCLRMGRRVEAGAARPISLEVWANQRPGGVSVRGTGRNDESNTSVPDVGLVSFHGASVHGQHSRSGGHRLHRSAPHLCTPIHHLCSFRDCPCLQILPQLD